MNGHNRRSSRYLFEFLDDSGWSEKYLAKRTGLAPSVISAHLAGQRVIRRHHLAAYMKALDDPATRVNLFKAWLRDLIDTALIDTALPPLPAVLFLPLSEIASSGWHFARGLVVRAEHAVIALATTVGLMFHELPETPVVAIVAGSAIVAPALAVAEPAEDFDPWRPAVPAAAKPAPTARANTKRARVARHSARRHGGPLHRIERTISHKWQRLKAAGRAHAAATRSRRRLG
jgi:hypothetical protein